MLADLDVKPASNLQQAAQDLYVLGSPQSPMQSLLSAITRELALSVAGGAARSAVQKIATTAQVAANGAAAELQRALGQPASPHAAPVGHEIDARYEALRNYAGSGAGAGAPMALALQAINGLQQELAQQASVPPGGGTTAPPANDPLLALRAVAAQAPMPVQRWLLGIAESEAALHAGETRQQAAAALNGAGGPAQLCDEAVAGRYPFVPSASSDVPLEDFARLFAPGGLIDGFFASELRPFANTAGPVWKAEVVAGTPAPITTGELAPFQRAAKIRDAFFPAGSTAPIVHFTITPTELDAGAKQVTLDLGDSSLSYAHGPQRAVQVT